MLQKIIVAAIVVACLVPTVGALGKPQYVAYSLREASRQAEEGQDRSDLLTLGGITRIAGMIYDRERQDVILVGLAADELPQASLDDFVVALRARLVHHEFPLVSIDPVEDTDRTKLQSVRFCGHLEDTSFGRKFLDADVLLKKYSLQELNDVAVVRPYNARIEDDVRERLNAEGVKVLRVNWMDSDKGRSITDRLQGATVSQSADYQVRFWFYVEEPYNASCKPDKNNPEVFSINELRICLKSEDILAGGPGKSKIGELYSQDWSNHFEEMCDAFPELNQLKLIYDMTAVADAIAHIETQPYLDRLLNHYEVRRVPTERTWNLEQRFGAVERSDGKNHIIRVSGGIEFRSELQFLNLGDVTALRDIVVKSRPSANALVWPLPLQQWVMPNAKDLKLFTTKADTSLRLPDDTGTGCSILSQSVVLDSNPSPNSVPFTGFTMPGSPLRPLKGVSMQFDVAPSSFGKDKSSELDKKRQEILNNRPNRDSLSWPGQGDDNK